MALRGIKVVELAGLAPAPLCGMILADFGASVLRVDKVNAETELDCLCNGKSSLALNLKSAEGKSIFRKLCKKSDVLIEPFRRGVMESLGLGPAVLLEDNSKLIYARLTGYGQEGSMSLKAGHDINYVSLAGLLSFFGRSNDKPIPFNFTADFAGGGLLCALGIVMALFERNSSGLGQVVDSSMVQGSAYVDSWVYRSQHLPVWGNNRGENILDSGAHFYETYETKDQKYMAVGALEPQFYSNFLKGLNLNEDELPQFGDFKKNKKTLVNIFKEKTQKEWCEVFDKLDACVTPVLSIKEAALNDHNVTNKTFVKDVEENYAPQPAPKLSRTPAQTHCKEAFPKNGQDTEVILKDLDFSEKEISDFERLGIIKIIPSKL
ncbi:alpha-methylacyl-CoA racemase isoform X1 [Agrilus planipennis]|uniref:Alpha-methylacyl-CoA racemase isoform X1 n=1 Tax=Agrilus planipennis TaxID=224129 RepID=A0A7F5R2Z0_AGRPL|nr:alpha-methylacyl-CoA racemase isoform X1 [Agrilus planipennis]XP_025829466.1 alpha-methylacyl-CoA racemase isoform X1 [Agrilus planipennis]XP_025829469.1 alpha-methylacyl-CoA racemase isoform X1 [Agrilus planipennis]